MERAAEFTAPKQHLTKESIKQAGEWWGSTFEIESTNNSTHHPPFSHFWSKAPCLAATLKQTSSKSIYSIISLPQHRWNHNKLVSNLSRKLDPNARLFSLTSNEGVRHWWWRARMRVVPQKKNKKKSVHQEFLLTFEKQEREKKVWRIWVEFYWISCWSHYWVVCSVSQKWKEFSHLKRFYSTADWPKQKI